MHVSDGEAERSSGHRAEAAGDRHDRDGDEPQNDEGADHRADIEKRQLPIAGEPDGERGKRHERRRLCEAIEKGRALRRMHGAVGEEARRRQLARATERPEREAERDEQPVDDGEAELNRIDPDAGDGHEIGQRRLGGEGEGGAH